MKKYKTFCKKTTDRSRLQKLLDKSHQFPKLRLFYRFFVFFFEVACFFMSVSFFTNQHLKTKPIPNTTVTRTQDKKFIVKNKIHCIQKSFSVRNINHGIKKLKTARGSGQLYIIMGKVDRLSRNRNKL